MVEKIRGFMFELNKIETKLCVFLLALITIVMSAQVVMRYIFKSPLTWDQELCILLLIYLSFFSADTLYRNKGHIVLDYFISKMSFRLKKVVAILINLLISFFLINIFIHSISVIKLQAGHNITAVLPLSKSYWILPITIVSFSMLITTLYFILELFIEKSSTSSTGKG
jgi:TRAP-type C4-dicarboxylate transport system permease small subunit